MGRSRRSRRQRECLASNVPNRHDCHQLHPTVRPPQIRPAISEPLKSSVRFEVVDVTGCQADIHQFSVTQVMQADTQPLALASFLKRTPISRKQTQKAPRRCGWRSSRFLIRESVSQRCNIGARCGQTIARGVINQGDVEVEVEPCGVPIGVECQVRLLGWHRMLLVMCRSGAWPNKKAPSDAGGAW